MRRILTPAMLWLLAGGASWSLAQDLAPATKEEQIPGVMYELPPTLSPAYARMEYPPFAPRPTAPQTIVYDPYFYPTHDRFRPFLYGIPDMSLGFYYNALVNPYYQTYYGPGEYYGY